MLGGGASFSLIDARHPLLMHQMRDREAVVPLSLELGQDRQALVITGPNTGGKTIALKTVGLLILMAQSGLLIPADEESRVGVFEQVFADIGDEQSIELSLSTFSSHIRNIISALTNLSGGTLVLFDEIGAGTDPKEGAALAEAIILYCLQNGALLAATTHYSQLKTLPLEHPQIDNASLEFDRKTLAPTYRLQVGIPGSSYAVEIASRLGMPAEVCGQASDTLGTGERSLAELISSLEAELRQVKADRQNLTERLQRAEELENFYRKQSEKISAESGEEKEKALAETKALLETTRRDVEQLVAEIRKSEASKESVRTAHRRMKDLEAQMREQLAASEKPSAETVDQTTFEVGDTVRVISLQQVGEIEDIGDGKARVRLGQFTTTVEFRNLERLPDSGAATERKRPTGAVSYSSDDSVSPEIHLRGMTVEEATESLEKFLDRARIAGLSQVYIVHGKGTGTLRRTLTQFLKQHPEVESVRLGNWNEGGAGVTIAKLKT
jgi:DNA mismatch repair protein MutS2